MVSEEHRIGLYIAVPVYFFVLAACAWWGLRRMERMDHEKTTDKISAHYLGGRTLGPIVTASTMFASVFSGYTVVGVPNEAYHNGWGALRWLSTTWSVAWCLLATGVRLRKASNLRNHQSPVDFITDRFQSQYLRYAIVFLQIVPAVIYLAGQVTAIKGTFNELFGLPADTTYPVIIIVCVILVFEWLGGLSCVALSDCFQAAVMIFSFIAVPSVIVQNFYGWKDLNPYDYPKAKFYQTPSKDMQWEYWQFAVVNVSFFTLPHFLQRTYAAEDLGALKAGYAALAIGNWCTMLVGVFIGTVGVQMLNGADVSSPYASIIEQLVSEGGFSEAVGIIAATSSLAAIMSTADSLVIGISQVVTMEIAYPLKPNVTPDKIAWAGRIFSMFAAVIALLIGILWKEGVSDLANIQFSISLQAVPSFLFGLYSVGCKTEIHPWCLATAAVLSTIYVFTIYFAYIDKVQGHKPINAGITGVALNLIITALLEWTRRILSVCPNSHAHMESEGEIPTTSIYIFDDRPKWDIPPTFRFGEHTFTPQLLWKSMEETNEPISNPWWPFLLFSSIVMATPLVPEYQPPIDPSTGTFVSSPPVINGVPWWAMKIIIMSIVPFLLLIISIKNMPVAFTYNVKKIEEEGINVDLVELTRREKGSRGSYDEINFMIKRRRNNISTAMENISFTKDKESDDPKTAARRRRLSSLVMVERKGKVSDSPRSEELNPVAEGIIEDGEVNASVE